MWYLDYLQTTAFTIPTFVGDCDAIKFQNRKPESNRTLLATLSQPFKIPACFPLL